MTFFPGVDERTVDVDGYSVKVYDSDPNGSKETVVLLHGTGGTAESSYWALFPMLAMRRRVVAFDFVDAAPATGGEVDYVEQARAVIESISADAPVDVVGYSFGAVIAALLAARHPERVRSLALVAGWLKTDAQQRLRNDLWWRLRDADEELLAQFTAFTTYSQQYINARTPAELQGIIDGFRHGADRAAKMRFNRDVDIADEITAISAPTLVIACSQDQMVPVRHSQLLFGVIPDARFATIDSGHGVMTERPSEAFVLIDSFFGDPGREPAGSVLVNGHA
ncbi:putative hydrolase [Microbacterium sp. HM58-2]|nr:putative hydrolase [Microbacterium sp. HM58-2]